MQEKKFSLKQSIDHVESMEIEPENKSDIRIKIEEEFEIHDNKEDLLEEKRPKKHAALEEPTNETSEPPPPAKVWRGLKYKTWTMGAIQPATKYKKPTDKEITDVCTFWHQYVLLL